MFIRKFLKKKNKLFRTFNIDNILFNFYIIKIYYLITQNN